METALALGAFDGLHKGHLKVIEQAVSKRNLLPAVLTFKENPTVALNGTSSYIISHSEKEEIFYQKGIKKIFDLDFKEIKDMNPEDFFQKVIVENCRAKELFCGENFRFGKKAKGDIETLKKLADANNIILNVVPYFMNDDVVVSSTKIRKAIENGDMKLAKKYLGRFFGFNFKVVQGNKIGRTLGTPTINQVIPKGFVLPKYGVYASVVTVEGQKYCGVTNVGVKPSIGKYDPLSETWIPDFEKDMYGMEIRVELIEFIRKETKFESIENLKEEIYKNAEQAKGIFKKYIL